MAQLARHGSEQGYREELRLGEPCGKCRNGHRVYARQFRAAGKKAGLKYGRYDVVDHLYAGAAQGRARAGQGTPGPSPAVKPAGPAEGTVTGHEGEGRGEGTAARLGRLLSGLGSPSTGNDSYVASDDPPEYLTVSDPDPEPSGQEFEPDGEYVINVEGMRVIEDNLGTYLSVVGMTAEMIDPYCGRVLSQNLDEMVKRWSKVIARYPSAAKLFLDSKGGTIMLWISAIQATWPVLLAIYEHHLAKTVVTARTLSHPVDATTPPMDDFEYSVR